MNIYNSFINLCYDVLSEHLHFPDVADTWKDIQDGLNKMKAFPKNYTDFMQAKSEIISYIKKVRLGNIIDSIQENSPFYMFQTALAKRWRIVRHKNCITIYQLRFQD